MNRPEILMNIHCSSDLNTALWQTFQDFLPQELAATTTFHRFLEVEEKLPPRDPTLSATEFLAQFSSRYHYDQVRVIELGECNMGLFIYGRDPDNQVHKAAIRALEDFPYHLFDRKQLIPKIGHVLICDPDELDMYRRFGDNGKFPYYPAISGYHTCAINRHYLEEPSLLRVGMRAAEHEILHVLMGMFMPVTYYFDDRTHTRGSVSILAGYENFHEMMAALPAERWDGVAYEHLLDAEPPQTWVPEHDFWSWYGVLCERYGTQALGFFENPVTAAFHIATRQMLFGE